jgi:hypothetical protein
MVIVRFDVDDAVQAEELKTWMALEGRDLFHKWRAGAMYQQEDEMSEDVSVEERIASVMANTAPPVAGVLKFLVPNPNLPTPLLP